MRKFIVSTTLALATAFIIGCTPGCTTATTATVSSSTNSTGTVTSTTNVVTSNVLNLNATTNFIALIVPPAVRLAVAKEPKAVPYLKDFVTAIALMSNTNLSPAALSNVLASTGIAALNTPEVTAAVDVVVGLYTQYYGNVVAQKLDQVAYLVPILQSIATAITAGLPTTASITEPTRGAWVQVPMEGNQFISGTLVVASNWFTNDNLLGGVYTQN